MQKVFVVDAFTAEPFKGNPCCVCFMEDGEDLSDEMMQLIAAEMNLSETAFVKQISKKGDGLLFNLRWFTPTCEVNFCGHGTLATAHTMFSELHVLPKDTSKLHFKTLKGDLIVEKRSDGSMEMNFPIGSPEPVTLSEELMGQLTNALSVPKSSVMEVQMCNGTRKLVCLVDSEKTVLSCNPNNTSLLALEFPKTMDVRGVLVTTDTSAAGKYDFVSRYFAPWNGIPEDPVTGSAHTVLGKFYGDKLKKTKMRAFQASKRGGELDLELVGDDRIVITGKAVTVLRGEIKKTKH